MQAKEQNFMSRKDFFPHVVYFGAVRGRSLYWDYTGASVIHEYNQISVCLGNGLQYCLPISYLIKHLEVTPYNGEKETSKVSVSWKTRRLYNLYGRHCDHVRVYDTQSSSYYTFSSDTLLMLVEPAHEDFGDDRSRYTPGVREQVERFLHLNPTTVECRVSPRMLKTRGFFHVVKVRWYKKPGIVLFFTRGGDRYGIYTRQYTDANDMFREIGIDKFKSFRDNHTGLSLVFDRLTCDEQNKLDKYVERLAFELDYRFRGHQKDYQSNRRWNVYPAERIVSPEYVWPSSYTYEYG